MAIEMTRGTGPARGTEVLPCRTLALGQIGVGTARQRRGGYAVILNAKQNVIPFGPIAHGTKEVFVEQFRQGQAPIMADARGLWANITDQRGQIRQQVIAAALFELFQDVSR